MDEFYITIAYYILIIAYTDRIQKTQFTRKKGMVCGKCWNDVSGGVVDGDNAHPYYRYGGLWKNRRAQT